MLPAQIDDGTLQFLDVLNRPGGSGLGGFYTPQCSKHCVLGTPGCAPLLHLRCSLDHGAESEPRLTACAAFVGERVNRIDMGSPRTNLGFYQLGRSLHDLGLGLGAGLLVAFV